MHIRWMFASLCLPILLVALALPAAVRAQDPDFSNTPDILNGQTHLLRDDDIVVAYPNAAADGQGAYDTTIVASFYWTANSSITGGEDVYDGPAKLPAKILAKPQVGVGRMFDLRNDVAAVVAVDGGPPLGNYVLSATFYDHVGQRSLRQVIAAAPSTASLPAAAVMADVTGDGYDDLVVSYDENGGKLQVISAADPGNWNAGLVMGPVYNSAVPFGSLAAGNLDGSGGAELVAVKDGVAPAGTGAELVALRVNPDTRAFTVLGTTSLALNTLASSVVTGNFDDNPADDEAIVAAAGNGTSVSATALLYDFDAGTFAGGLLDQTDLGIAGPVRVKAVSGRVHWFGPDQDAFAALVQRTDIPDGNVILFTVENDKFVFQNQDGWGGDGVAVGYDLALGRLDNQTAGAANPDLQLILLRQAQPGTAEYGFLRYDFDGEYDWTSTALSAQNNFGDPATPLTMALGDLQGRSLRLGAPNKITIDGHSAPSVLVGMPPMHMDWVVPSCNDPKYPGQCTTPQDVGILVKPASTYAQLNTQEKASSQSSSKKTTSYSLATKESIDGKIAYGIPDVASVSVEVKDAAKQTHDSSVATTQNSYASVAFDASVRTGFADHIWFDSYRFNIWTYPVIGRTVCPDAKPSCSVGDQAPLQVQFSGPDQIQSYHADGNLVEWYQPVWEPGNLLSYPWTEGQLEATLPRAAVNNRSDVWAADSSGANASVTWSQGGGQDVTQGSSNTYSNDLSTTVAGQAKIGGFGISDSVNFDVTTSKATQTLNTASSTHGSSTGFSVAKTGQDVPDYVFAAQTYILGQAPPTGTLQTLPLTTTVQTTGPLQLGYRANPFDSVLGGDWWPTTYTLPDVALNHPQRWSWSHTPVQPNIMTFNQAVTTTSPYDQEFYTMRGLYVTSQGSPEGPQLTTAPVTETVLLQARVYNYSHVDMNAASLAQPAAAVKVRFYGQLFHADTGVYPEGDSFLIGERTLSPIPGFDSTTTPGDIPNWTWAVQPFDPRAFVQTRDGNAYVRFWVVVWMEDATGKLVQEMAGHGLTASPTTTTINTMGDVGVEPYSNNVGTFKQVFYIQGPTIAVPQVAASEPPTLALAALVLAPPAPRLGLPPLGEAGMAYPGPFGKHQVSTTVQASGSVLSSVQLLYYDGDPTQGGRLFEWELIPYIGAGAQVVNRVTYTPQDCGMRTLYVVARAGDTAATQSIQVENVPCLAILPSIGKQ